MADQLSLRGGTTAEHATFTGANKEVTVDTTKKTLVVNDGATVGGHPLMRENASNSALALGSAGTPSLKFTGDTNTGIYSPGADQLAVATNGTGRLFVDASGNVGVGGSPSHLLDCRASSTPTIRVLETTNGPDGRFLASASDVQIGSYGGSPFCIYTNSTEKVRVTTGGLVGIGTSSPGQGQAQINTTAAGASDINAIALNLTNNSTAAGTGVSLRFSPGNVLTALRGSYINSLISGANGSDLQFWTCGDGVVPGERMRIDSSGNVGIGTTTVNNTLHLSKEANHGIRFERTTSNPGYFDLNVNSFGAAALTAQNAVELTYASGAHLGVWNGASEALRVDNSSRLLIGTSTARANTFNGSTQGGTLQVEITGGGGQPQAISGFYSGGSTPFPGPVSIYGATRSTAVGGNTLLADGDRIALFSFQGNDGSEFVESASISAFVDGTPGANDMPGRLVFSTTADGASSPTERMRLGNSGKADFFVSAEALVVRASGGSTSTNNALSITSGATGTTDGTLRFVVETRGNVFNQNNAYGSLSDVKLKENIVDASSQWSDLKNLKVRKYNFKEIPGHTQIGLVAQEVELVSPGLVSESPDRDEEGNELGTVTKSLNYSVLYMKAVKALQEAMERIEQLEARLTAAGIE
jgi:hypothetical protein